MRAVVQGFGPFGDFAVNPSELLVRSLAERGGHNLDLVAEVLPVSMQRVAEAVPKLMDSRRPDVWLGVGLAAGRTALSIEAVAVNLAHWPRAHADADGVSVTREPVAAGGAAAYLTTLPVAEILGAWRDAGIPGYLSQSAGSYLCNLSFYCAARAARDLDIDCRVGFLHVPLLPDLVTEPDRQPSMSMTLQAAGLDLALAASQNPTGGGGLYLGRTA
jgi:pyroglutamyl-peptidase